MKKFTITNEIRQFTHITLQKNTTPTQLKQKRKHFDFSTICTPKKDTF